MQLSSPAHASKSRLLLAALLALTLALTAATACSDDGQQPDGGALDQQVVTPVTLTIATFNVHNFFDAQDDPNHQDDLPTPAAVQYSLTALGKAIRAIDADIIALQEVENYKLLQRLNSEELGSLNYVELRLVEGNDYRGIDVALLSRFKTTWLFSHVADTFKGVDGDTSTYGFSRDCLEVEFQPTAGRTLTLLINHLRSESTGDGIPRRQAQAQQVRKIADEVFKKRPDGLLAVLGDLNDTPESKTVKLITTGTPQLVDLLTLVPAAERYTFSNNSNKSQLDYIIASPALQADLVAGSVKADHRAVFSSASDHFPVSATFTID